MILEGFRHFARGKKIRPGSTFTHIVGLHFSYAPCFVSEYRHFPSSEGAGLQKIMLGPPALSNFLLHILCAMLAQRNKNSGKVGKTKAVALPDEFSIIP